MSEKENHAEAYKEMAQEAWGIDIDTHVPRCGRCHGELDLVAGCTTMGQYGQYCPMGKGYYVEER